MPPVPSDFCANLHMRYITVIVRFMRGVKTIQLIDLFEISNFSFGWNGDCNGFVQQLRGIQRVRE